MTKTLREKVIDLFDVVVDNDITMKQFVADLNRRGKVDTKKMIELIFLVIEEVDSLKTKK